MTDPIVPDTTTVTPPPEVPTPPTETTPPSGSEITPPTETPVAPDLSAIEKKLEGSITERVSKTLLEKIGGALGLTKEEKEELPKDPKALAEFIRNNSKAAVQEVFSEREKQEREQQEAQQQQMNEGVTRFQTLWKDQYAQLADSGRVPKITDPNNKNDPGILAKGKILAKLHTMIKENEAKGIDYVPTLKEVFYENPNLLTTNTVAGATVPVSGGGRSMAQTTDMAYDALHKSSIDDLVKKNYQ